MITMITMMISKLIKKLQDSFYYIYVWIFLKSSQETPTLIRSGSKGKITYESNGNFYKILFPIPFSRSRKWMSAFSSSDEDISCLIEQYSGPFSNFHGISTTPKMLGFDFIKIIMLDETIRNFSKEQEINLQ